MKPYSLIISEQSLRNLIEFLQRVPLKGSEVPAFNQAVKELQSAKQTEAKQTEQPKKEK